jgi:predicted amidohydrolase YtcJ
VSLVLEDVELDGTRTDVRVVDGTIDRIGAGVRRPGDVVVDGGSGALTPGLHDHHLHLAAMAAARQSVDVEDEPDLHGAVARAGATVDGWIRVVGYHEAVHGPLDRQRLDRSAVDRPVRVQHQSGARWILNTAALDAIGGLEAHPDGVLDGRDDWLRSRVPPVVLDLLAVGRELARVGVTGCTDATPTERIDDLRLLAAADLPQRITVTGGPGLAAELPPAPLALGPVKLLLADHSLPGLDHVVAAIGLARAAGRTVAVHAVTLAATLLALAAWDEVGPLDGDRLEHGSVLPPEAAERLARAGLRVVTQPGFVWAHGDRYRRTVDAIDRPHLYRCAGLLDAGIRLAGSTDAPYGPGDPWVAMRAAVDRRTRSGAVLGPGERLSPAAAFALFQTPANDPGGSIRRVVPGATADLCLFDAPLRTVLEDLDPTRLRAVYIGGVPVWVR